VNNKKNEFNFDEIIDRTTTHSIKWDSKFLEEYFSVGDLLPLWVADMDFRAPPALLNELHKRVDHGIFGYTLPPDSYLEAIINWFHRRHDWKLEKDWIKFSPGVVPAINIIIQAFSRPGDNIIIQEPVYYPFADSIKANGRNVLNNQLVINQNHYEIDFKDLEEKCKTPRTKMIILCSPHNPVGRVWKKDELERLAEICIDNNVLIISDEIHCDLIFNGHKHIPIASLSEKIADHTITCVAPSKTFNVAGLKSSNVIITNKYIRENYTSATSNLSIRAPGIFGMIGTETVYNDCEDWLDALLIYLWENYLFLKSFIEEHFPSARVFDLEGTYLPWIDFNPLGIEPKILDQVIKKEAKVGLDDGAMFGPSGAGFQRFNIACPKAILKDALEKIQKILTKHTQLKINKK